MSATAFTVRVRFDASGMSIARARAVVETLLDTDSERRFRREEIDEILLGLQESLTNVARHAYRAGEPAIVELLVRVDAGRFRASIRDRGRVFEPPAAPPPPPNEGVPRQSGYGLLLMDRTMDRVAYQRRGNRNLTRLARTAGPAEPEPIRIKLRPISRR